MTPEQLELRSLIFEYEIEALAIYDMERADPSADDFLGIDLDASIAKRRAVKARLLDEILGYAS